MVVALALLLSALGVGAGGPPWAGHAEVADEYPQRIEKPYVVRDLPAVPGPVAGLIREGLSWFAVSPRGRVWVLADALDDLQIQPALSDDGRLLAYLRRTADRAGEYVIRDLVNGTLTVIPGVAGGTGPSDATYYVAGQQPTYVSPDGQQVLARGGRVEGRNNDGLLVGSDGIRELFIRGVGWPAGWAPDGRLAWLRTPHFDGATRVPELVATTDTGVEIGRLRLELSQPMEVSQWSARLSPDAAYLALSNETDGDRSAVVLVALEDGREVARHTVPRLHRCQPTWRGDEVLTPSADHVLADADGDAVIVADPAFEVDCSIWATGAISGVEHGGFTGSVFGTGTAWWSWRWRQLGAGLLLIVAALGLGWARGPSRRSTAS